MTSGPDQITHVSDTALMVAACRAIETARDDGFVHDPYAERLAGERGMALARGLPDNGVGIMAFGIGARSHFLDELVPACVSRNGIDTVVSLGCGLDTRPWRVQLPPNLRWLEVDFEDMLEYKYGILGAEAPKCRMEHMAADLNDPSARQKVFGAVGPGPALMITEGLLMYLPGRTVEAIATESVRQSGIRHWISDITTTAFSNQFRSAAFRTIDSIRDPDHLSGEQILERLAGHGWASLESRRYAIDMRFAAPRIRRMFGLPPDAVLPPPPLPDDPSGAQLFHSSYQTGASGV
jgi:methyltransferase (TIGR00027 family)